VEAAGIPLVREGLPVVTPEENSSMSPAEPTLAALPTPAVRCALVAWRWFS
jgi:hypothetical protein